MYVHYIHHNVPHHYHQLHQRQHHHHHDEPHLAQGGRGQWGWRGLRGGSSPSQPPPYQSFLWKTFPGGWGAFSSPKICLELFQTKTLEVLWTQTWSLNSCFVPKCTDDTKMIQLLQLQINKQAKFFWEILFHFGFGGRPMELFGASMRKFHVRDLSMGIFAPFMPSHRPVIIVKSTASVY